MVKAENRKFRISRKAEKFIRNLPEEKRKAVKEAIRLLMDNRPDTLNIKKLAPYPKEFRLKVDNVRILFKAAKEEIFIFKAGYRGQVYKQ